MPQIDLVKTLVRCDSGGDSKVSCETLVPSSDTDPDPNLPPDSIRIPIQDSDIHYTNLNLERDDSAKESTNPKSQSHPNPNNHPNSIHFRSNSQRTNIKANGPILGLPNKIKQVTCTTSRHHRQPATNSRIFPKKKSAATSGFEPSSPKVSCFGKVLSDRERSTCRRLQSRDAGCWKGFSLLFSCGGNEKAVVENFEDGGDGLAMRRNIPLRKRNIPSEETAVAVAAPGLGGMKRFASGRRSASGGGDVEAGLEGHVAVDQLRRSLDGSGVGPVAV